MVSLRSDIFFSIPPWVTYSTPEVRNIPINNRGLRGCVFPDEVNLRKMKQYSYNNCITECRENYTLELCGCNQFYYRNNGSVADSNKVKFTVPIVTYNYILLQSFVSYSTQTEDLLF
jgi:hypothetical protein